MIVNRELSLDDYLAICRRRAKLVILPALVATAVGFAISYGLTPKYTSRSYLLVEGQIVPTGYVKPIVTERVSDRMLTLQQNVLSRSRLQSLVSKLGLATRRKSADQVVEDIRNNVSVIEADPNASTPPGSKASASSSRSARRKTRPGETDDVPGFYVSYTTDNPRDAQQVCSEITSMLVAENLQVREQLAQSTTEFLAAQVAQAKRNLDDLDSKLSQFNKTYLGKLPTDTDKNLKILAGLNARLDGNTQNLSRAQQDKSFAESLLAQEFNTWKTSLASPNLSPLRQQLVELQNRLVTLQARYTADHPDIVKLKKDIAELQSRVRDLNAQNAPGVSSDQAAADKLSASGDADGASLAVEGGALKLEPPEILRLREQVHRSDVLIDHATAEQARLQELIAAYQSKLALPPAVEEQYRQLTRDTETAHNIYDNLLTNKSAAEVQTEMERRQQGEQIRLVDPANLPDSPSFPLRWMFALGGLGAGVALGIAVAVWLELRDKSIRSEADVIAALQLPMLVSVPWLNVEERRKSRLGSFAPVPNNSIAGP